MPIKNCFQSFAKITRLKWTQDIWCNDYQHKDTFSNDIQPIFNQCIDTRHKNTQHKDKQANYFQYNDIAV